MPDQRVLRSTHTPSRKVRESLAGKNEEPPHRSTRPLLTLSDRIKAQSKAFNPNLPSAAFPTRNSNQDQTEIPQNEQEQVGKVEDFDSDGSEGDWRAEMKNEGDSLSGSSTTERSEKKLNNIAKQNVGNAAESEIRTSDGTVDRLSTAQQGVKNEASSPIISQGEEDKKVALEDGVSRLLKSIADDTLTYSETPALKQIGWGDLHPTLQNEIFYRSVAHCVGSYCSTVSANQLLDVAKKLEMLQRHFNHLLERAVVVQLSLGIWKLVRPKNEGINTGFRGVYAKEIPDDDLRTAREFLNERALRSELLGEWASIKPPQALPTMEAKHPHIVQSEPKAVDVVEKTTSKRERRPSLKKRMAIDNEEMEQKRINENKRRMRK